MNAFFSHLSSLAGGAYTTLAKLASRYGWKKVVGGIVVILVATLTGKHFFFTPKAAESVQETIRSVAVSSVADLSSNTPSLSVSGTVQSTAEATVRTEAGGQVTAVAHSLGDYVGAGTIVAQLESSSQRAAVLQAQGVYDAAKASYDKTQKGTRTEQLANLQTGTDGARSGAVATLLSAYAAVDSAIRGTTDTFFTNPESNTPHFNPHATNNQLTLNAETQRLTAIGPILKRDAQQTSSIKASDDLGAELTTTAQELRTVRDFLDTVIAALNAAIPDPASFPQATISGYITSATAARTSVNGTLSAVVGAKQTLETSLNNQTQGVTGAQPEDIAAAAATVTQAQGALAAARANLEKAIIRSPISGTINSFSLKQGDYVQNGQEVLNVANNGALEILAYVTEQDAPNIAVGNPVTIQISDSQAQGVITRIAPALDPVTKRIEVRIGVSSGEKNLVNGQSVLVTFGHPDTKTPIKAPKGPITIPITAIKIGADSMSVFTVGTSSALVAHDITIGSLLGDRVEIKSGITPDMIIVTDARGLRTGENVVVK